VQEPTKASNETPSSSIVTSVAPLLLDARHKQILAPWQELPDTSTILIALVYLFVTPFPEPTKPFPDSYT
jgi:hypothetical protein